MNGEVCFVDGEAGLLDLIEHVMGYDTRSELEDLLVKSKCGGECDVTYRQQEHYQRVIHDALEDLRAAQKPGKLGQVDPIVYSRAIKALEDEL